MAKKVLTKKMFSILSDVSSIAQVEAYHIMFANLFPALGSKPRLGFKKRAKLFKHGIAEKGFRSQKKADILQQFLKETEQKKAQVFFSKSLPYSNSSFELGDTKAAATRVDAAIQAHTSGTVRLLTTYHKIIAKTQGKGNNLTFVSPRKAALMEKLKLSLIYGNAFSKLTSKKALQHAFTRCQPNKLSDKESSSLFTNLFELLENRLDSILVRSKLFSTIGQAREMIRAGNIKVQDKTVRRPSFVVTPGDFIQIHTTSSFQKNTVPFSSDSSSNWRGQNVTSQQNVALLLLFPFLKKSCAHFFSTRGNSKQKNNCSTHSLSDDHKSVKHQQIHTTFQNAKVLPFQKLQITKPLHLEVSYKSLCLIVLCKAQRVCLAILMDGETTVK